MASRIACDGSVTVSLRRSMTIGIFSLIIYCLELASNLSVLLLAFGLIASMANVLTKGSVLTDNVIMQRVWAWTQCLALDTQNWKALDSYQRCRNDHQNIPLP